MSWIYSTVSSVVSSTRQTGAYYMQSDPLVMGSYGMPRCIPDLESKDDHCSERLSSSGTELEDR